MLFYIDTLLLHCSCPAVPVHLFLCVSVACWPRRQCSKFLWLSQEYAPRRVEPTTSARVWHDKTVPAALLAVNWCRGLSGGPHPPTKTPHFFFQGRNKDTSLLMSVYLSVCVCLSDCLCLFVCLCLSVCLSVYLYICLSICLSVCLSVCLFVYLSLYLAVCLSLLTCSQSLFCFLSSFFPQWVDSSVPKGAG